MATAVKKQTAKDNLVPDADDTIIKLQLSLTGIAPALMHAANLNDPLYPPKRRYDELNSKGSKKTLADNEEVARIEWYAALYWDEELGPYFPSRNVKACLIKAGGLGRKGAAVERGVTFAHSKLPLIYEGPRGRDELFAAGFAYTTAIRNSGMNGGRVQRTRPCFEDWALEATIYVDPHQIGLEDLGRVAGVAQRIGIGDYRPEFGTFRATLVKEA